MKPVWGLGIAGEEQFSLLPSVLPEEFSFLEIPGDMLESPGIRKELKIYLSKFRKALVIRDILPVHLVSAAPLLPLHLKIEFDQKFRSRCETASRFGCHFISAEFNFVRAFSETIYRKQLLNLLRSISGILEEFKLKMLLPVHFPADGCAESFAEFVKLKKELFYPGFHFLLNCRYHEDEFDDMLEKVVSELSLDRRFWRLSCMPEPGTGLDVDVLEKLRPVWENISGDMPACVCFEPGNAAPDQILVNALLRMLKKYNTFHETGTL